jgi:hypothetical protein
METNQDKIMRWRKSFKSLLPAAWTRQLQNYYWTRHPKQLTNELYLEVLGKRINWKLPQDLNEKIQWLKLYSDTSHWSELADKYRVRQYVAGCGLSHLLNELYACYDSPNEIDITHLPESFVIKQNNACGDTLIVTNKTQTSNQEIQRYFFEKRKRRYGILSGEPHYLKIQTRIIAEKLLENTSAASTSLIDYKLLCFHGKAKCVLVCANRRGSECDLFTYDLNWRFLPECLPLIPGDIPRPRSLDTMIEAAEKLSQGFPFVRVDFFDIDGQAVFGEMTFTPAAGFINYFTPKFLLELGSYIQLPDSGKSV